MFMKYINKFKKISKSFNFSTIRIYLRAISYKDNR